MIGSWFHLGFGSVHVFPDPLLPFERHDRPGTVHAVLIEPDRMVISPDLYAKLPGFLALLNFWCAT